MTAPASPPRIGWPTSPWRGRLDVHPDRCRTGCAACLEACPTAALSLERLSLDLGACVSCGACTRVCPTGALTATAEPRAATSRRDALVRRGEDLVLATALPELLRRQLGRNLRLRVVDTGDCGGCTSEVEALFQAAEGFAAYGIELVLAAGHADGVLLTGPITPTMAPAFRRTWLATAPPRLVIAVGACAISGGPFRTVTPLRGLDAVSPAAETGAELPEVHLYVPGCPPHPLTLLDGLLRLLGHPGLTPPP